MRDIDLTPHGKNIKHFAWKQRLTHKYSSLCVVPFEGPDTLIKINYLTVCNVIKALLAPPVAMFTQWCSHIKAHEHSKWSFVSRGPVRTEYLYQHCPWSLTVCSGRTSVCTLCPQFRRGWPNKSLWLLQRHCSPLGSELSSRQRTYTNQQVKWPFTFKMCSCVPFPLLSQFVFFSRPSCKGLLSLDKLFRGIKCNVRNLHFQKEPGSVLKHGLLLLKSS